MRQAVTARLELQAPNPTVALAHDYLTQRGGAERVVLAMSRIFPDAPIHTSLYEPRLTYPEFSGRDIRTSRLDRHKALRRRHRLALPLLAPAFSSMQVDADVVLCSSSGWAHGVETDGRKIVYCHAPARWLYQQQAYLSGRGRMASGAVTALRPALVRWDRRAARSADQYLVNSTHTQHMVRDAYGIEAEVLHPPHGIDADGPQAPTPGVEPGFLLCVSRLMPYKNVDMIVEAMASRPDDQLLVVGSGPEAHVLRSVAPPNVRFLGEVSDSELRWLYAHARALVAASYEDFGLTPIEAGSFGTPTVALRFGGYLDTVVEARTGTFFDEPTPRAISDAFRTLDQLPLDPEVIRRESARFDEAHFAERLLELSGLRPARDDAGTP